MTRTSNDFSQYVAILGRGKTKTRALTLDEAQTAMDLILDGKVEPEQLGAFLMLMRIKEETPEEIAGFVRSVRTHMDLPTSIPQVDFDWSSYAGKRRQLPWYLLSVLLLARNGFKIFMHGTEGHTPGRIYTRDALQFLGLKVAENLSQAADQIASSNFSYIPLEILSPKLKEIIELRPVLGLRSPVHSLSRMINPFNGTCSIQGIFHPSFMETHQEAAIQLGMEHMAVFRGEGGEGERRPHKPCEIWTVHGKTTDIERWPPLIPEPRQAPDENMELGDLLKLWSGELSHEYGEAAVIGTLAIALKAIGHADTIETAVQAGRDMWAQRDKAQFPKVA